MRLQSSFPWILFSPVASGTGTWACKRVFRLVLRYHGHGLGPLQHPTRSPLRPSCIQTRLMATATLGSQAPSPTCWLIWLDVCQRSPADIHTHVMCTCSSHSSWRRRHMGLYDPWSHPICWHSESMHMLACRTESPSPKKITRNGVQWEDRMTAPTSCRA